MRRKVKSIKRWEENVPGNSTHQYTCFAFNHTRVEHGALELIIYLFGRLDQNFKCYTANSFVNNARSKEVKERNTQELMVFATA